MPSPRFLPILALAVLLAGPLAPLAAAQPGSGAGSDATVADLHAPRLDVASALTSGPLAAIEDFRGAGTMAFEGRSVEVVVEEERGTAYGSVVPTITAQEPVQEAHADVQGAMAVLRDPHRVNVLPVPGEPAPLVLADRPCAALRPSGQPEVRPQEPHTGEVRSRHPTSVDTRAALAWDVGACPGPGWTVVGTFLLVLYGADATVNGKTYTSGTTVQATGPNVGGVNATEDRTYRFVYLTVRDGRVQARAEAVLFLASAEVSAEALTVDGATGTVPALGGATLDGGSVSLAGDLTAHVAKSDGGPGALGVRVTGRLESGAINGQSITVSTGGGPSSTTWMAALLALPALAGGAAALRGGPAKRLARLERLGMAGRGDVVARRSRRLQRHEDLHREATALRIEALAMSGRGDEAIAEAERLGGWEGAVAAAYVHAMAGQVARAVAALRPWHDANAAELGLVLRQPAFAAVRRDPEAARWLQGATA